MIETKAVNAVGWVAITIRIHPLLRPIGDECDDRWIGEIPVNEADARAVPCVVVRADESVVARISEREERVVGARWIVKCGCEVCGVLTDAIRHEIKNDFDATRVCCVDEREKLRLRSEARIERVSRTVLIAVIGRRWENRLQVDHGDAEVLEIVEALGRRETAEVTEARGNRTDRIEVRIAPSNRHDLIDDLILRRPSDRRQRRGETALNAQRAQKRSDTAKQLMKWHWSETNTSPRKVMRKVEIRRK